VLFSGVLKGLTQGDVWIGLAVEGVIGHAYMLA